jgi:hypothetical protein
MLIEGIAVDSASNETVAVTDMTRLGFPNLKWLLRDAAHSARRVLQRLWGCDPVLSDVLGIFCHWRDSMGQLIQWSPEVKDVYKQCCAESSDDAAVSTEFGTMRAAKHRIETFSTPLSRAMLNPTALVMLATKLAIMRQNDHAAQVAKLFLGVLCPQIMFLAALMADAGLETLAFIRLMDTEGLSTAVLTEAVADYLASIAWLFHQKGVFAVKGHTAHILKWLERPHFYTIGSEGRCIGGVGALTAKDIEEAFDRLKTWTVLVKSTLEAEFPEFDLMNSFSVFKLGQEPMASLPDIFKVKLSRLSRAFRKPKLQEGFLAYYPYAHRIYVESGCTLPVWECWGSVMKRGSSHVVHDVTDAIAHVVKRGQCFLPVTSGVEQSFAQIAAKLGDRRLGADNSTESRAISLLLEKQVSTDDLACRARRIFSDVFGGRFVRQHKVRRWDKGVRFALKKRPAQKNMDQKVSENMFRKRLHSQIQSAAASHGTAVLDTFEPNLWTEAHEAERAFQLAKRRHRLIEAHGQHLTLDGEATPLLQAEAHREDIRQGKSHKARQAARARVAARLRGACPSAVELHGKRIYVEGQPDGDIHRVLAAGEMQLVGNLADANIFVCQNPWKPCNKLIMWAAVLSGAWIMTAATLVGSGPATCIKFDCALRTRRKIFVTPLFRDEEPGIYMLILELMIATGTKKWELLASGASWASARVAGEKGNRSAEVLALLSRRDAHVGVRHAFQADEFLQFVSKQDHSRTTLGIGSM